MSRYYKEKKHIYFNIFLKYLKIDDIYNFV